MFNGGMDRYIREGQRVTDRKTKAYERERKIISGLIWWVFGTFENVNFNEILKKNNWMVIK